MRRSKTLEREVATGSNPEIRDLWATKRDHYESRLIRSADHLLESVGALRVAAERVGLKVGGLDDLASAIAYKTVP